MKKYVPIFQVKNSMLLKYYEFYFDENGNIPEHQFV